MQESQTTSSDAEEFKLFKNGYRCLDHYRQFLCTLYTEPDNCQLHFERWKVSKIRTYKDRGTLVKHEYLVATLRDADGNELELRMERRLQESSAIGLIAKSLSVLGSASPPAAAADIASAANIQSKDDKFKKWAADEISICSSSTFTDDQVQVDHFRFQDGHHVPLPQLVVLACAINEYCAFYHITMSNCYWFCYVASEALKKRFNHTLQHVNDSGELGCWHGIPIYKSSNIEAVVTEVLANYDRSWNEFRSKVDQIVNNPHNRHTLQALEEVKKERSRTEQERARADMEEDKRIALERKVELYKATLESLGVTVSGPLF